MQSVRHNIRIALSLKKLMLRFEILRNFSNCKICGIMMMSVSMLGREYFRIYPLNNKSLGHDDCSTKRYVQYLAFMDNIFKKIFMSYVDLDHGLGPLLLWFLF